MVILCQATVVSLVLKPIWWQNKNYTSSGFKKKLIGIIGRAFKYYRWKTDQGICLWPYVVLCSCDDYLAYFYYSLVEYNIHYTHHDHGLYINGHKRWVFLFLSEPFPCPLSTLIVYISPTHLSLPLSMLLITFSSFHYTPCLWCDGCNTFDNGQTYGLEFWHGGQMEGYKGQVRRSSSYIKGQGHKLKKCPLGRSIDFWEPWTCQRRNSWISLVWIRRGVFSKRMRFHFSYWNALQLNYCHARNSHLKKYFMIKCTSLCKR